MRESPSQDKLAADSAGPAPAPELETLPEQVLQEVAPAPAHTEIGQLVADMQPLALAATVDIAWLSQLGPFDAQQALALAASAGDALAQIRANTTAVQDGVINPFIQYWQARLSRTYVWRLDSSGRGPTVWRWPRAISTSCATCSQGPVARRTSTRFSSTSKRTLLVPGRERRNM